MNYVDELPNVLKSTDAVDSMQGPLQADKPTFQTTLTWENRPDLIKEVGEATHEMTFKMQYGMSTRNAKWLPTAKNF